MVSVTVENEDLQAQR